ncbi:MAG: nitrogen fixation/metabolism regulation signal transduction histidine kinase [Alteromonadaceae bacterium]
MTATVASNGKGGATVTFSGGNGPSRSAAKNAVAGKLSGAGFNVSDIGSQKGIAQSTPQQDEKYLHLLWSDQGSGIANKENLFVPFYSTKPQGSGIGLTLCRQIMFNHGGLIKLTNRKNNNGAQAVISLPLQ